jgi:hypothetical protein
MQLQGHLIQHIACAREHKRAERGGQRSFEPVGSVRPTEDEREWPNHRGSLHDRKERDPSQKRVSKERHKEQDGLAHRFRKQTRQKTPLVALYKRSQLAPISCFATLGNKTKNKTLACQPIVLSRTRQRDKRSHRRAGNKDPERCSPNDRKRCRIRDRSHRPLLALRIQSRRTEPRRARLLLYWELNNWARGVFWVKR